jgi:hypothetical protein
VATTVAVKATSVALMLGSAAAAFCIGDRRVFGWREQNFAMSGGREVVLVALPGGMHYKGRTARG